MSQERGVKKPTPNFWFCYGLTLGGLAFLIWPSKGDYFGHYWIAHILVLGALGGIYKGIHHLRVDRFRRQAYRNAQTRSGKFGKAHFAGLAARLKAGLHEPSGKFLMGLADYTIPTFLPDGLHFACQAPPGAGKSSALVSGAIYHGAMTGRSLIVSDIKGEHYHTWAAQLEAMGFRVVVNNPGLVDGIPHNGDSNPIGPLIDIMKDPARHGEAFVYADNLSRSLIKEIENDKNAFFKENDRAFFVVMAIIYAAFHPDQAYPAFIWRALVDPHICRERLFEAKESDILNGDLASIAAGLLQKEIDSPDHFESGRTGASQALSIFKPSSLLGSVGATNEFTPEMLRDDQAAPTILFDIVPPDKVKIFGKLNALQQTARMQALKQCRGPRDVMILADEATNMPIPTVIEDIELLRSFKITIALFYQSLSSLQKTYGKDGAASIRASSAEFYTQVGDYATAKEIADRIGDTTIKTNNQNFSEDGKPTEGVGETGRRFFPPEEILAMSKDEAIILMGGLRPIKLLKTPAFMVEPYKSLMGKNPHEDHPPCKTTMLTLEYGKDAREIGAPVIPGFKQKLAAAASREAKPQGLRPEPLLPLRSLLWVPIMAAVFAIVAFLGTPHVIFEYQTRPSADGTSRCLYFGLSGMRDIRVVGSCSTFRLIRHETVRSGKN
ncbi:MAG: type IV secretory system conjugative DNA transfer family protein [Pseudomonadota bacterium]